MKGGILKFGIFCIALCLSYTGIFAISDVFAYFDNTEISESNSITTGILDIFVDAGAEFEPVKLSYGSVDSSTRIISIANIGTLTTQYQIKIENVAGDLCPHLELEAELNANIYNTAIAEGSIFLISPNPQIVPNITNIWNFKASLISQAPNLSTCNFDITFNAWQDNLTITQGFNDSETVSNYLEDPIIIIQNDVVGEDPEKKADAFRGVSEKLELLNFANNSSTALGENMEQEEEILETHNLKLKNLSLYSRTLTEDGNLKLETCNLEPETKLETETELITKEEIDSTVEQSSMVLPESVLEPATINEENLPVMDTVEIIEETPVILTEKRMSQELET